MNVVMFAPEDLNLVKGSPQVRRRFIDMEIGQISPVYLHEIGQFNKILQQRNHYLKQMQTKKQTDETMLDILTEQFIQSAAKIVRSDLNSSIYCKIGQHQFIKGYLVNLKS